MWMRVLSLALAAAVVTASAACDEALSELTGPTENLVPTFSSIQRDILSASDATGRVPCTNCHNGNGFVPGNFTGAGAYASLVGARSVQRPALQRVTPGDPNASYLIRKLQGGPDIGGTRMPLGGPYLTDGQIRVIRRWIELGANND
jgi:hypothetical protein